MKTRSILLGAAAVALLAGPALGQSSTSTTTPDKKHHHHHVAAAGASSVDARIDELEREIHELKEQQAAAPASTNTEVSGAQFEALQNQVYEMTAAAKPQDKKIHLKGITVTLGGFLAAESVYRSHNELADIGSSYSAIPFPGPGSTTNNAVNIGHGSEFRFTARQSRISGLVEGDPDANTHLAMYGEFDFLGAAASANSNESNSYTPRIRNLYGTIDLKDSGWQFLFGQSWSLATLTSSGMSPRTEVPPPSIDAQYVPGFDWTRQPQLRVVKNFGDQVWLGVSLENPQTTVGGTAPAGLVGPFVNSGTCNNGGNGLAGAEFNPCINLSLNHVPDVIGKIAVEPGFLNKNVHLEAFGIYRDFYDRTGTTAAGVAGIQNHNVSGGGFGVAALAKIIPGFLDLQADAMFGNGIGRYGSAQLPDTTYKADGELAPLKEDMEMVGLTLHATSDLDIYAFGGREHDDAKFGNLSATSHFGYGNPAFNNTGCFSFDSTASCTGNTKQIDQITAGLWDTAFSGDFGKIKLGLQYSYTERKAFEGVGGAPKADENMVFTSVRYYPF
jgi:hypothetical protein